MPQSLIQNTARRCGIKYTQVNNSWKWNTKTLLYYIHQSWSDLLKGRLKRTATKKVCCKTVHTTKRLFKIALIILVAFSRIDMCKRNNKIVKIVYFLLINLVNLTPGIWIVNVLTDVIGMKLTVIETASFNQSY